MKKVGVVGCGLMGGGIAQVCAESGYETVAREINDELLNKGISAIQANWKKAVAKGRMTEEDQAAAQGRLKGTTNMNDFEGCDLVIEAVIELMDLKKEVFTELDNITPPHAILATNTSCLSIIEMASFTKRPEQVMGIHFFNPVPVMKLVEVVETISTSQETMETGRKFSESLGKQVVTAKDSPGFIVNLLLIPFLLDAIRAYEKGLATKEDIDAGVKLGLNHPMGPLTLTDLVGLDTTYHIACAMYEETADSKYAPPVLLKQMVTAGWYGRKSGKGFYDY
ncbi:MAG: 3-hydroxybutyryl-CoA dehydrogenase [Chloroflexi bacterium]|nr:3-hydroxybutyryl-CoA dehydrogenase [Chloroflexota bacterium]